MAKFESVWKLTTTRNHYVKTKDGGLVQIGHKKALALGLIKNTK